jgi:hypothetical protein
MHKTILTLLGSAALAASFVQVAAAAERHHARNVYRTPAVQTFRDSNAWVDTHTQPYWSRYEGGAISAPAGH